MSKLIAALNAAQEARPEFEKAVERLWDEAWGQALREAGTNIGNVDAAYSMRPLVFAKKLVAYLNKERHKEEVAYYGQPRAYIIPKLINKDHAEQINQEDLVGHVYYSLLSECSDFDLVFDTNGKMRTVSALYTRPSKPGAYCDRATGGFYYNQETIPEKDRVPGRFQALFITDVDPFKEQ